MATGSHLEYFLYDTWPRRRDWETNHYSILPPLKNIETTFPPNKLSDVLFPKKKETSENPSTINHRLPFRFRGAKLTGPLWARGPWPVGVLRHRRIN